MGGNCHLTDINSEGAPQMEGWGHLRRGGVAERGGKSIARRVIVGCIRSKCPVNLEPAKQEKETSWGALLMG